MNIEDYYKDYTPPETEEKFGNWWEAYNPSAPWEQLYESYPGTNWDELYSQFPERVLDGGANVRRERNESL